MTNNNQITSPNNSYSQALYELSIEENSLNEIEKQSLAFSNLISQSEDLRNLIKDPTNTLEQQSIAINAICSKFNLNALFTKFLKFLINKRRLFYTQKILNDFLSICSIKRGEITAKLTAAKNLNEKEIENIKNSLKENFGSNLKLSFDHDPDLIGGLIIQVGSVMIDTSIKSKLKQLENKMIEA